jgi:hypothetical protein
MSSSLRAAAHEQLREQPGSRGPGGLAKRKICVESKCTTELQSLGAGLFDGL